MPSRLEGIETKDGPAGMRAVSGLHVPSRLEGIETVHCFAGTDWHHILVYMCLPVWRELKQDCIREDFRVEILEVYMCLPVWRELKHVFR